MNKAYSDYNTLLILTLNFNKYKTFQKLDLHYIYKNLIFVFLNTIGLHRFS